jgi:branched-chain amino acid transport system ATP-binding protein
MEYILSIEDVKKTYSKEYINLLGKTEKEIFYVLDNLSMQILNGKITALMGGNGSGKTTLFNIICGYYPLNSGKINYFFKNKIIDLAKVPSYKMASYGIGRMFQGTHIFRNMTVLENMMIADNNTFGELPFSSLFRQKKTTEIEQKRELAAKEIFENLLKEDNPLWQKRYDFAGSLSYGHQRILALARLFMNDHLNLILLDEPCAGVNPDVSEILKDIIIRLRDSGKTILLIEHNLDFIRDTADYCYYLENGKIVNQGKFVDISYRMK